MTYAVFRFVFFSKAHAMTQAPDDGRWTDCIGGNGTGKHDQAWRGPILAEVGLDGMRVVGPCGCCILTSFDLVYVLLAHNRPVGPDDKGS